MGEHSQGRKSPVALFLLAHHRVLGLRLSFKDLSIDPDLEESLREHSDRACMAVKSKHLNACHQFCSVDCAREVSIEPAAFMRHCPFGHSEIVCRVERDDTFLGWLSAGALWLEEGRAPRAGLIKPKNKEWLADRMVVLESCAQQLGQLLQHAQSGRRAHIMEFIQKHLHQQIGLGDLARELDISISRCGHLIRELCGETFPQVLRRRRCDRAARLLIAEDISAAAVGKRVGIHDASYFCDTFKKVYGSTPDQWRKRMRENV